MDETIDRPFRHELKYYINKAEEFLLRQRLMMTLNRDAYADQNGEYHIRSLYFDDIYESALATKLDGTFERKKFRIRIYNLRDRQIKLECKEKFDQFIHKRSLEISRSICDSLISGDPEPLLKIDSPLAKEMFLQMRNNMLRPRVIVDYIREAYVSPIQDVRITFDKHLRTGLYSKNLFDKDVPTVNPFEDHGTILEVKFNEFLPEYYHSMLRVGSAQRSAISKYCVCRRFE